MAYFEAKRAKISRGAPPRTPSAVRFWNVTCPPDLISELLPLRVRHLIALLRPSLSCVRRCVRVLVFSHAPHGLPRTRLTGLSFQAREPGAELTLSDMATVLGRRP